MFNHYVRIANLTKVNPNYRILLISEPTQTKRFNGDYNFYDHYYRLVTAEGKQIKYGKFQQLDKLAQILDIPIEDLEQKIIINDK